MYHSLNAPVRSPLHLRVEITRVLVEITRVLVKKTALK